jgi:tetratricopeptide (TPR) repeat protein
LLIRSLTLNEGARLITLLPGGQAQIDPLEPLKLASLDTNRWKNYDLSFYSPDFDIDCIRAGSRSLLSILGEALFFDGPVTVTIQVKDGHESVASFSLKAAFSVEEWVRRGDAERNPVKKVSYYQKALELEPDSDSLSQKYMASLSDAGLNQKLAQFLEESLAKTGDTEEHLLKLLAIYREAGHKIKEISVLERLLVLALKNDGSKADAYRSNLAALYRDTEPLKSAMLYEGLLINAEPDAAFGLLSALVDIYRETESYQKEIETLEKLIPLALPESLPSLWTELIRLREITGDLPGQKEAWAGLAGVLPPGLAKANAYKRLAVMEAEAQDLAKAEEAFLAAAAHDESDPVLFLNLARLCRIKGDREAYRGYLEKTLALEPKPEIRRELAAALEEDGFGEKALPLWESLAELKGDEPEIDRLRREARIYVLQRLRPRDGEYSQEFEEKLYGYSDNLVEFYNLGVSLFKGKHWDRAEKAFLRVLESPFAGEELNLSDVRSYLLAIYKGKSQTEAMLAQAMLLYRDNPAQKEYRDLIIYHHEKDKDWRALGKAATEWTKWQPQDPDNWRFLALALKNTGRPREAALSFLRAAQSAQASLDSWLAAAEALEKAGEGAKAKLAYEKVMELDPKNVAAESALLRLAISSASPTEPVQPQ